MKKTIIILSAILMMAFKPTVTAMQFETVGVNITQLPSINANGTWTWKFIAWYRVKGNTYSVATTDRIGMVTNVTWGKWVNITMITNSTDATLAIPIALDSANAYRLRNFPDQL